MSYIKDALKSGRSSAESLVTLVSNMPPRRLRRHISPLWFDYKATGQDQLEFMTELAGLTPDQDVLDIGCGVGRLAMPLTNYLSDRGSYDGFDNARNVVDWCRRNISSRRSNFRFHLADVLSSTVPGAAGVDAAKFKFPFSDASFDLAYAGSLFTHLLPDAAENYLKETARTLRPGGRLVATFNLYNSASILAVPHRRLNQVWPIDHGYYRLKEANSPESNVSYDETWIRNAYQAAGMTILEPFRPDASYSAIRRPKDSEVGANLWYSMSVIGVRV
ncbi:class I SAM-dependent methyltransferase [Bosea thiooxidans]